MSASATATTLVFPSEEAFRVALTSGLVPATLQAQPVAVAPGDEGALRVVVSPALARGVAAALRAAGVTIERTPPSATRRAGTWAQALLPRERPEPAVVPSLVLFEVLPGGSLLELAGELLRLGCDRQVHLVEAATGRAWLRAVNPPYFSVARTLDRTAKWTAFVPSPAGQEKVWTQLGYEHPLASAARPSEGALLLIHGDGRWEPVAEQGWTDLYHMMELVLPVDPVPHAVGPVAERLRVTLRLARSPRLEAPSLWVLRREAFGELDALVQNAPEDLLHKLLFAASQEVVVLRARPGSGAPPELVLSAEAYTPHVGLPNVFVPKDTTTEPPLRREKLRELLLPAPDRVVWLASTEGGAFRVESVSDSAFSPLTEWAEYVVHSAAPALEPWVKAATFAFDEFESTGGEWGVAPAPKQEEEEEPVEETRRSRRRRATATAPAPVVLENATPTPTAAAPVVGITLAELTPSEAERELAQVEQRFVALETPADDPERTALWHTLAELNTRLNRAREAGLAWTRQIWEASEAAAPALVARWAAAETSLAQLPVSRLLERTNPSRDETRAVAAQVLAAAHDPSRFPLAEMHQVQVWLEAHEEKLDVRSLWLMRVALAKLAGGDRLGLARAHDRVLTALQRGLSLERDVPTFLRFGAMNRAGAGQLTEGLDQLLRTFEKTKRQRAAVEAPAELTAAYVQFVFAYGFARLGDAERARALVATATAALKLSDKVHGFLARAYAGRVQQALEGLPPETPLPPAIASELNGLETFARYKVDRQRQASTILESQERLDPIVAFQRGERDPRGPEFAALRGLQDAGELSAAIARLAQSALAARGAERVRLMEGVFDFLPSLPAGPAGAMLQSLASGLGPVEAAARVGLVEKALSVAAYFARREVAAGLTTQLVESVDSLPETSVGESTAAIGRGARSLRRVGLRAEAGTLLERLLQAPFGDGVPALVARVHVAGGLAAVGRWEAAELTLEEAIVRSAQALTVPDRLALARALSSALGQTQPAYALSRVSVLASQLAAISDSFNTNSHFCLSVVHFMESLVLSLASDDLELGEAGRRWLDEDEYLVRRRVHREMGES